MPSPIFKQPGLAAFCLAAFVLMNAGCNDGRLERVPVSGSVSYDGQPVAQGTIRFSPLKGQPVPLSAAQIKDGKYTADSKGGVAVGEYRVVIEAYYKKTTESNRPLPPGVERGSTGWVQYMPPKYGKESELTFTVESGSDGITKDFDRRNDNFDCLNSGSFVLFCGEDQSSDVRKFRTNHKKAHGRFARGLGVLISSRIVKRFQTAIVLLGGGFFRAEGDLGHLLVVLPAFGDITLCKFHELFGLFGL